MLREQPLRLTRDLLAHCLGDRDFYRECPVFLFLRGPGTAAADKRREERAHRNRGAAAHLVVVGLARQLAAHMVIQHANNPDTLRCLAGYFSQRHGYWPRPLTMSYRLEDGQVRLLELDYPQT